MTQICRLAWVVATMFTAELTASAAEEFRAGVAIVNITPSMPLRMSGYFMERLSTGTKDPLHAKAIVFQQGDEQAALVFCDLIGISLKVSREARRRASDATGIPVDNIAISATHSHTGPLYCGALHDYLRDRNLNRNGKDLYDTSPYVVELIDKIVTAIVAAKTSSEPVDLLAGEAREDRLSFNRRFHMKDGTVQFNPGELNPNIVRAAGPIDPQVGIVVLRGRDPHELSAAIVSFALHLDTTSGTEYSADYPRFVQDRLREAFHEHFTLLFGAGTCGDINHVDVRTRDRRTAESIGNMLAETVEQAILVPNLSRIAEPSLAVRSAKVEARLQKYSVAEIAKAKKDMALIGTRELPFLEQVEAYKIVDLQLRKGDMLPLEVQAFRLSRDTAIVTLPGEIFVELGLVIKAASPFKNTLVIELANDCVGYVPTTKAFAEGSYEIVNSRVQPGSGEQLVEAAIAMLKELE